MKIIRLNHRQKRDLVSNKRSEMRIAWSGRSFANQVWEFITHFAQFADISIEHGGKVTLRNMQRLTNTRIRHMKKNVAGSVVPMADHVRLLGVKLDNRLSMDKHVNEVTHVFTTYVHCDIFDQPSITVSYANMIACSDSHRFSAWLRQCCVVWNLSKNINRLQRIQNVLAQCILDSRKVDWSSYALLHQLHWLPIRYCIDYKLAKLTFLAFLARSSCTSSYLISLVACYLLSRTLRSEDTNLLAVLRTKTVFGSRAFHVTAPTVFNSLP